MKYLLDINILLAAIWKDHAHHARVTVWMAGKTMVLCPLTQIGFIRVSTNPKAIHAAMEQSRQLLKKFQEERQTEFIADDLSMLQAHPKTSAQVTDHYLAALADHHGLRLATLDTGIKHPAVEIVT